MQPINRPVRIVLKSGRIIKGRRLNEDTYTVQVMNEEERLQSIMKSDARTIEVETTSPMPSYGNKLTQAEITDVVAYLMTLRER